MQAHEQAIKAEHSGPLPEISRHRGEVHRSNQQKHEAFSEFPAGHQIVDTSAKATASEPGLEADTLKSSEDFQNVYW
jgi:hypothetical protein